MYSSATLPDKEFFIKFIISSFDIDVMSYFVFDIEPKFSPYWRIDNLSIVYGTLYFLLAKY